VSPFVLVEETETVAAAGNASSCVQIEDALDLLGCARPAVGGGNGSATVGRHFVAASLAGYNIERDVKPALENLLGMFECYASDTIGPQLSERLTDSMTQCLRNIACDAVLPRCSEDCTPQSQCASKFTERIQHCLGGAPLFTDAELEHFKGTDLVAECSTGALENLKGQEGDMNQDMNMGLSRRAKTIVNAMANAFAHGDITYAVATGLQLRTSGANMSAHDDTRACHMESLWGPTSAGECMASKDGGPREETSAEEDEIIAEGGDPDAELTKQRNKMPVVWSGEPDAEVAPAPPENQNEIKQLEASNTTNASDSATTDMTEESGGATGGATGGGESPNEATRPVSENFWASSATVTLPGLHIVDFVPSGFKTAMSIELGVESKKHCCRSCPTSQSREADLCPGKSAGFALCALFRCISAQVSRRACS
jgi:hypothetical protein